VKVLVTGQTGFVGRYLTEALVDGGHQVSGYSLRSGDDVRDFDTLRSFIGQCVPDQIFHLAAVTWPRESVISPQRCMDINVNGTMTLLEAVRQSGVDCKIHIAGTSEEYGYNHPAGTVLDERAPCFPVTPYGVSKLAATTLGMVYAQRYGLHVVATRAFNHTGPGRQACNAESAFARRIAAVERGEATEVAHGPLGSRRNFTDVRDVVRAYMAVISATPGIYNVCSGTTVSMGEIMDILAGLSAAKITLRQLPGLGSAEDAPFPPCTYTKLHDATGWKPRIPLAQTLSELLDHWRKN
jgi:GDP-4-dehydro-6-deoxy-D-mannose reductase